MSNKMYRITLAIYILIIAACLVLLANHVGASDPMLSNVPPGQAPDLFVWTTIDNGWYLTTDCVRTTHTCRTVASSTEDLVVQWVYKLQEEFTVEYLS